MKKLKGLIAFLLLFFLNLYIGKITRFIFARIGIGYIKGDYLTLGLVDYVSTAVLLIILIIVFKNTLIGDLRKFKKEKVGFKEYLAKTITLFMAMYVVEYLAATVEIILFNVLGIDFQTSANQSVIEEILKTAPLLMVISASLFAPLQEEILYRGGIRETIKNKGVFIAVSGIIFGLLHVTGNIILILGILLSGFIIDGVLELKIKNSLKIVLSVASITLLLIVFLSATYIQTGDLINYFKTLDIKELLNGITYVSMGIFLAYVYAKTNNIYYTIGMHLLKNSISALFIVL